MTYCLTEQCEYSSDHDILSKRTQRVQFRAWHTVWQDSVSTVQSVTYCLTGLLEYSSKHDILSDRTAWVQFGAWHTVW
jgi:hypothetical protein